MKVKYFAWVRERVGKAEEELDPPPTVTTVGDLIAWLSRQGENYAIAFDKPATVRIVVEDASGQITGKVVDATGAPVGDAFLRA